MHEARVHELKLRGYRHYTPLDADLATGNDKQDFLLDPYDEQVRILQNRGCGCLKTHH